MPLPRHPPQKAAAAAFRPYPPARGTPMLPGATARAVAMAAAEAPPGAGPGQWLGQSEAARRLGWHLERLKAAARRGRLQRRKGNAGQWLVYVPDSMLPVAAQGDGQGDLVTAQGSDSGDDSGAALGAPWAELLERATRAEGELAAELRRSADLAAALALER